MKDLTGLDRDRLRELFDLRKSFMAQMGGAYQDDPNPIWRRLREQAPVHEGTVHDLSGCSHALFFHGLPEADRRHFSVFTFDACDEAYRNPETFASSPHMIDLGRELALTNSMLSMGGVQHRRYRGLVQPSFVPAKAEWWIKNWIDQTVDLLIDGLKGERRAELNTDFCAAIPVLTITGSFGVAVEQALEIRAALQSPERVVEMLTPIVAFRREAPRDDLISVLVEAELTDTDGVTQRLSDPEIYSFALLLLAAGSGTTWKQMGITLVALLARPDVLTAVKDDRQLLRPAIEESLRWSPTDPMFSRWVTRDLDFHGVRIPKGSVVHLCLGAANRDSARWERADDYDIFRSMKPSLAFGSGPHICLGMHLARAEMSVGIGRLLDRLPNLRLDPGADAPRIIGFYERGAMEIPVIWDA